MYKLSSVQIRINTGFIALWLPSYPIFSTMFAIYLCIKENKKWFIYVGILKFCKKNTPRVAEYPRSIFRKANILC